MLKFVTAETFHDELMHHDGPAVMVFTGPQCRYCNVQKPVLEKWAAENGFKAVQANAQEEQELAKLFRVETLPTTVFFAAGAARIVWKGIAALEDLQETMAEAIADGEAEPLIHSH